MVSNFHIETKKSRGNLHVMPTGNLDGNAARELLRVLHENYEGSGRVFIKTDRLDEVSPAGCQAFRDGLNPTLLPMEQLFFKGEKGLKMAPGGSRVLILGPHSRRCRCSGRCAVCKCAQAGL